MTRDEHVERLLEAFVELAQEVASAAVWQRDGYDGPTGVPAAKDELRQSLRALLLSTEVTQ